MYASKVDDQALTFFVSGKLWGRSLVMGDKETGSEWSHILGRAMAGPLEGKSLKIIPSTMTNWGTWLKNHPSTTVTMLKPTRNNFNSQLLSDSRKFGLGLVHNGEARFWRFDQLEKTPVVNDQFEGLQLVIYFDAESRTPFAWSRKADQQTLRFRLTDEGVQDEVSNSTWDLDHGVAVDGPMKGTQLEAVPAIVSFTSAWRRFHPDSTRWLSPGK